MVSKFPLNLDTVGYLVHIVTLMVTQAALLGCAGDVLGKVQLRASCSLPHGMCRAALAFFLNICLPGWLWKKGKQWELQLPWPGFVAPPWSAESISQTLFLPSPHSTESFYPLPSTCHQRSHGLSE